MAEFSTGINSKHKLTQVMVALGQRGGGVGGTEDDIRRSNDGKKWKGMRARE
jgi:hypothetical protein